MSSLGWLGSVSEVGIAHTRCQQGIVWAGTSCVCVRCLKIIYLGPEMLAGSRVQANVPPRLGCVQVRTAIALQL